MKIALPTRKLVTLLLVFFITSSSLMAANEPIPSGSFIINMGVTPQTYGNGIKPWGMVYDLIKNYKVQVKWVINQSKLKDGIDFTYNDINYKGGTFIILPKYRSAAVNASIAYWQTQGVVGITTATAFTTDVTYTLKYTPRWTFDFQNGSIALSFLTSAGIPTGSYPQKNPAELNDCDDLFVMPHADPTWATHNNLLAWNQNNGGWIWAGCHAVSVLENLFNPLDPTQQMNFLSQNGLVPFNNHQGGSPPYSYRFPTDPEMQFMGIVDNAMQNGSEQIFLPETNTWRPTTKVAVYDPTQQNVPGLSPGEAGAILYGRAFGDNTRGEVMYEGGHNINKNNADAVAAMRAFFNFSFLSVYDKVVTPTITGPVNVVPNGVYTYRLTLPAGANNNNYTYHWSSSCGGIFSNPFDTVTNFTAGPVLACSNCNIMVTLTDGCGREYYQTLDLNDICPLPPVALDRTCALITNPPGTAAQAIINATPLAGTDEDGYVVNYVLKSLPANGVLSYDNDNNPATADVNISSLPGGELVLTNQQMKSLKFDPADGFGGNATFLYTVTDNTGLRDLTPATYIIPVNPPPQTLTFICTPVYTDAEMTPVCPLQATDNGIVVSYTIVALPPATECTVYLFGVPLTVNQVLTPQQSTLLTFKPTGSYIGYAEITYTATDNIGAVDPTPATLTLQIVNRPPVTNDISAPTIADPVGSIMISIPALSATDADGSVVSYTITSRPDVANGVLYYNNGGVYTAVNSNNKLLTTTQAASLKFDPADTLNGVAVFNYTATDNDGLTDNTPATYSIPVKAIMPIANNITNAGIYSGAGLTTIHALTGSDPDSTNIITKFIVTILPDANKGVLKYNNAGTYMPVVAGMEMTPAQGTTLKFAPTAPFKGNAVFRYTVKDDEGYTDPTSATFTIPVTNSSPTSNNVTNATLKDTCGLRTISTLVGNDADGTVASYIILTIPDAATGVLYFNGNPVVPGQVIPAANANSLQIDPVLHNSADAVFNYTSVDDLGFIDPSAAIYTIPFSVVPWKIKPVTSTINNPSINTRPVQNSIVPLNATDADGYIVSYQIKSLCPVSEGKLYLQGIPVVTNQYIPADKADQLSFNPSGAFKGTTTFKYKAFDNDGQPSSPDDNFNIPIVNTPPVAVNFTSPQVKKGLITNLPPLMGTDVDGTIVSYKILTLPLPTKGTLQYDSAGTNTYVNVVPNRNITPAQASRIRIIASNAVATVSFAFTVKDNLNDTSVVATYTIPIGIAADNMRPIVNDITSAAISFTAGITAISPLTATDLDGTIASYIISAVPPPYYGMLYYNSTGAVYDSIPIGNFPITVAQAATLKFKPSGIYNGAVTFKFKAIDNTLESNLTPAVFTIPLLNADPIAINITNAAVASSAGPTILSTLTATDDGSIDHFIITDLPNTTNGILVLDGSPVELNQLIPAMYANRLEFDPNPSFSGNAVFKYSAVDDFGNVDQTPATFTIPVTNQFPTSDDKLSQVITNKLGTGAQAIPDLTGVDNDGTITAFIIKTLPTGGILYKNGTAINSLPAGGLSITPTQATQMSFDPNDNFSGMASFTYTVKDNDNNIDQTPATYQIPVNVPPVTNNVISNPFYNIQPRTAIPALTGSDDGAVAFYSILSLPASNAGILYVNNVPINSLSQVDTLSALQVTQLSFEPAITFTGAIFTYTATDNLGVIDVTPAVYTIPLSNFGNGNPLPIDLLSFTGNKLATDNILYWSTSQEVNSKEFELEHSLDGTTYTRIATVTARSNVSTRSDYSYTDKDVINGIHFYRLKLVDIDGKYKYSKVVVIKRDGQALVIGNILPNPFKDKVDIELVAQADGISTFTIYDIKGSKLKTLELKTRKGLNHIQLSDLSNLDSGIYLLNIRNNDGEVTAKLYKSN